MEAQTGLFEAEDQFTNCSKCEEPWNVLALLYVDESEALCPVCLRTAPIRREHGPFTRTDVVVVQYFNKKEYLGMVIKTWTEAALRVRLYFREREPEEVLLAFHNNQFWDTEQQALVKVRLGTPADNLEWFERYRGFIDKKILNTVYGPKSSTPGRLRPLVPHARKELGAMPLDQLMSPGQFKNLKPGTIAFSIFSDAPGVTPGIFGFEVLRMHLNGKKAATAKADVVYFPPHRDPVECALEIRDKRSTVQGAQTQIYECSTDAPTAVYFTSEKEAGTIGRFKKEAEQKGRWFMDKDLQPGTVVVLTYKQSPEVEAGSYAGEVTSIKAGKVNVLMRYDDGSTEKEALRRMPDSTWKSEVFGVVLGSLSLAVGAELEHFKKLQDGGSTTPPADLTEALQASVNAVAAKKGGKKKGDKKKGGKATAIRASLGAGGTLLVRPSTLLAGKKKAAAPTRKKKAAPPAKKAGKKAPAKKARGRAKK